MGYRVNFSSFGRDLLSLYFFYPDRDLQSHLSGHVSGGRYLYTLDHLAFDMYTYQPRSPGPHSSTMLSSPLVVEEWSHEL